ncbi:hypothetical protein FB451DRAFT_189123 [Mycena latifolia]|nr:hypothetical protein FB451DRAFT_189123 [Mycena latifolia]
MQSGPSQSHTALDFGACAGSSGDGWWNFDSSMAAAHRPCFPVSSSRVHPTYMPDFDIDPAMDPQYCFPPRTDSAMALMPFSPSFSPMQLHLALESSVKFSRHLEAGTPDGSGYWLDPRLYDNATLQSPQWSAIPSHALDPWTMSAFDVPDALAPYSPHDLVSPLPHILPRPPSPSDSGRLSPLSVFTSSAASSRRSSIDTSAKRCSHCDATVTPLWRRNPATRLPLCNACGLYLQQRSKMRPVALIEAEKADDEPFAPDAPECSHCHTRRTSVWRRSKKTGSKLCNACGVFERLRGKERPLHLRHNKIKPRCKHSK